MNPRVPVVINGKACVLAFDMAAARTLKEKYGLGFGELAKLQSQQIDDDFSLLAKFLFAMTRSMDDPPTEKDIERMSFQEIGRMRGSVERAMQASVDLGLGERKAAIAKPAGVSALSGAGARRSSRRSTASASRRRSSGD